MLVEVDPGLRDLNELIKRHQVELPLLEDAHITSRCASKDFSEEEVREVMRDASTVS